MEKYIPYEKMSKKMRREYDAKKRGGWGEINPVTRRSENPAAYNRTAEKRKTRKWSDDSSAVSFLCLFTFLLSTRELPKAVLCSDD